MLPVIPLASISTVALMGIFARQNQKQGWVKRRKPMIDRLREIHRELHHDLSTVPEVAKSPSVWAAGMSINATDFSQQLGLLQTSLQRANSPVVSSAGIPQMSASPARERVAAGS